MAVLTTVVIEPSAACRRLGHQIDTRAKQPGPGRYEYCVLCTAAYARAKARGLSDDMADQFVKFLRDNPTGLPRRYRRRR